MNKTTKASPPIIAIDDSPEDLFLLQRVLQNAGANVSILTFGRATEAMSYLTDAANSPDPGRLPWLVFTDLHMPTINGLEFLAWIRSEKLLNRLPVVMLSTSQDPQDIERSKSLGVDRYFVKFPSKEEMGQLFEEFGLPGQQSTM